VDLDKYEFYGSPGSKRRDEFCPLYTQSPKLVKVSLNGFVSLGKSRVYVQSVPVSSYTIEGYGDADDETVTIFVQSKQASNDRSYDIWYRLTNQPTTGYRPFYDTFVWIATFCKHFLDYLGAHPNTSLGLSHFKIQFFKWLMARFKGGAYFQAWLKQFGRSDFRQHVNAHSGYLFDQAYNLPNRDVLLRHDVWGDCLAGGYKSIQLHPVECQKTITTPLVYQCFSSSYFANHLEERSPTSTMREKQNKRKHMLGFPTDLSTSSHQPISSDSNPMRSKVPKQLAIGDVVEVLRDTKTQWKETGKNWLAYVWRLQPLKNGTQKLGVVWLCRPSETVIGQMVYPIEKEVFFSDVSHTVSNAFPIIDLGRSLEKIIQGLAYLSLQQSHHPTNTETLLTIHNHF
jgi:DNA (cytosine-5)-methyltransferase 1